MKAMQENENKNYNDENRTNLSAFNTQTQYGPTCYGCGETGHIQKDCWRSNDRSRGGQRRGYSRGRGNNYQRSRNNYRGQGYSRGRSSYRGQGCTQGRSNYRGQQRGNYRGGSNPTPSRQENLQQSQSYSNAFIMEVNKTEVNNEIIRNENEIEWILDSGCTDHIINDDKFFDVCVILEKPVDVKLGDGRMMKATKVGRVNTMFKVDIKEVQITLNNVVYVREMKHNLLSYAKVTDKNKIISYNDTSKIYNPFRELIAIARKVNNIYKMTSYIDKYEVRQVNSSQIPNRNNKDKMTEKEKWHRTLGHVNFNYLNTICKNQLLDGLPKNLGNEEIKCAICIESKMHNLPFENDRKRAKEILEIVHTDLNGPHPTVGNCGVRYFLSFVDDRSKLAKVFCIKSKAEVSKCIVEYVNLVENITGKKIKNLRCDNGKEYINKEVCQFAKEKGISIATCPPYVHELNGVAERFNRTIMDSARCLLKEARVNARFWPEIVKTATYLKNRTLANTIEIKTPYEIFFAEKPNAKYIKLYGSRVFVRTPESQRKSKWDDKAKLGVLLGYTEVGYRVLINNKVIVVRYVDVVDNEIKYICFNNDSSNEKNDEIDNENQINDINDEPNDGSGYESAESIEENRKEIEEENILRRFTRQKKFNPKYCYETYCVYANYCNVNDPNTFEEAMECEEVEEWQEAMHREVSCIEKNKTWEFVDRPKDKKVIDVKWIFRKKSNNIYKARLVVRGYQQKEQIENTYSPVAKMETLKILLSYCCQNGMNIEQMDVKTAFLNGIIISEVYVNQPQGYQDGTDRVYKLYKSLYGLRESPRSWYECFHKFMNELKFERSKHDYCLYGKNEEEFAIYLIIFVDDLLIYSKDTSKIQEVKSKLSKRFKMKDMGQVSNYIGIDIENNLEKNVMTLSQENYIMSLAKKYELNNAKLYKTPMETNLKLEPADEINEQVRYRNLIGELLFISTGTRPDITFSVNYLSRFQSCFNETHFKYAMRILKYLYLTKNLKLTYTRSDKVEVLDCLVDSDWAGDIIDRKSTSGYIIRLYGNVIYWKTRKQKSVTKSSTEAEYVALSEALTEINFIRGLLSEVFKIEINVPIKIYEDNSGAVTIAKSGNLSKKSKYIEVQYHDVYDNYEKGKIDIVKIDTEDNIADILTKSLCKPKFVKLR